MGKNFITYFLAAVIMMAFVLAGSQRNNSPNEEKEEIVLVDALDQLREKAIRDSLASVGAQELASLKKHTLAAKYIAGMEVPVNEVYSDSVRALSGWNTHRTAINNLWDKMESTHLKTLREWSDKELEEVRTLSDTVFYPFSGPDFLFSNILLPKAKVYYLAGLEPVGEVPFIENLDAKRLSNDLLGLRVSLDDILNLSFFKTNDMKVDFKRTQLKGIIPVLFTFFVRTGHQILNAEYLFLTEDGTYEKRNAATIKDGNKIPCVKVSFRKEGTSEHRELFYFSVNLHNSNFPNIPQFSKLVKSMNQPITYLKGASYLMYKDYFYNIRDLILDNSIAVLGDDSGMPYKNYTKDSTSWDAKFWGEYYSPIPLFANWFQADLRAAYVAQPGGIKQLPFGLGYNYTKSHLMLFTNKAKLKAKK